MSYGKDERDIHKHVWELPIPEFTPDDSTLARIAELGAALENIVASFALKPTVHFAAARRHIRAFMMDTVEGQELEDLVSGLLRPPDA